MKSKTAQPAQTQIMFHKKGQRRTLITNTKSGSEYELLYSLKAFVYSSYHSNNTSFYLKFYNPSQSVKTQQKVFWNLFAF